jgi:Secretion system C-terminal sorting domain
MLSNNIIIILKITKMKNILLILFAVTSNFLSAQTECSAVSMSSNQVSIDLQAVGSNFILGAGQVNFSSTQPLSVTLSSSLADYNVTLVDRGSGNYRITFFNNSPVKVITTTASTNLATINFSSTVGLATKTTASIFQFDGSSQILLGSTSCSIVLPVELLTFKGIKKGAVSQLQWEATGEKNLVNYIIERSTDGRNFHPVGFTKPRSTNATEKVAYDFVDDQPDMGVNYYRLLSKGLGKDEKFSKVISLDFGIGLSGRAYPNPLDGDLSIDLDIESNSGTVDVGIYDVVGKQILSRKIENNDRRINMTLPTADLAPGSYIVKVKVGTFNWERKITKM